MSKKQIAGYDTNVFGESESIRILSSKLEEKRMIKTMFGELDRVPNHDGYFELINTDKQEPKKQFIVQIKHVTGKSTETKLSYDLPTEFLYYVKKKVTENPAIIFIVDIQSKNIFWKYLSDEYLMNLDFENKKKVRMHFNEVDLLNDIDVFTTKLSKIVNIRNRLYVYKTPQEIEEIQTALDWLNDTLNSVPMVKKSLYPNLWRFGIATSKTSVEIESDNTDTEHHFFAQEKNARGFSIYPQIKGTTDTGIRDFQNVERPSYITYDLTKQTTPLSYVKSCFEDMLEKYFNYYPLDFSAVEEEIIFEVLFCFLDKFAKANKKYSRVGSNATYYQNEVSTMDIKEHFAHTMLYTQNLFADHNANADNAIFRMILNHLGPMHSDGADILELVSMLPNNSFNQIMNSDYQFDPRVLTLLASEYISFYYAIQEAEKRNLDYIKRIWPSREEMITDSLISGDLILSLLPNFVEKTCELYQSFFKKSFSDQSFEFVKNIEINFAKEVPGNFWKHKYIAHWYDTDKLSIKYNKNIEFKHEKNNGLLDKLKGTMFGWGIDDYLLTGLPLYLGIKSLLYQGICHKFDINCQGVLLNSMHHKLLD